MCLKFCNDHAIIQSTRYIFCSTKYSSTLNFCSHYYNGWHRHLKFSNGYHTPIKFSTSYCNFFKSFHQLIDNSVVTSTITIHTSKAAITCDVILQVSAHSLGLANVIVIYCLNSMGKGVKSKKSTSSFWGIKWSWLRKDLFLLESWAILSWRWITGQKWWWNH